MIEGSGIVLATAGTFVGTHFVLSHPLRRPLVTRLGEQAFSAVYSLVAAITFGATAWAYWAAPITAPAWAVGDGLWALATLTMLVASILLMGSLIRNPALPGAASQAATTEARGVYGITRHPMMWSFALWGVSHILVWPTAKNVILSGAIIVLALAGAAMQDRKKAQLDPQELDGLAKPHQLPALCRHRAGPRPVRRVRASRHPRRPVSVAGGDLGAPADRRLAGGDLAVASVTVSGCRPPRED